MSSSKADDNGAYLSKGSAKQFYTFNNAGSSTTHKSENGSWFTKVKESKVYKRNFVGENEVYELTRQYCTNKDNPDFSCTIAIVRSCK